MNPVISPFAKSRIIAALRSRHPRMRDWNVEIHGEHPGPRTHVTLALGPTDESLLLEIEVAIDDQPGMKPLQAVDWALDALDWAVGQFFTVESGLLGPLPAQWSPLQFSGQTLWARSTLRRPALERRADALLAQNPPTATDT